MSRNVFERYAPFIQNYIFRKKWENLREIQVEASEAILDTNKHVIIASGTASGKTEAAFFPILTLLNEHPSNSIGVIYIGPLKALINDQFERLNELLQNTDIPVWSWHGDVAQSHKKKALKTAKGILQITPESLEALIMRHPGDVSRLFSDLRFVVIDEMHALMGEDRGLQVLCLLNRLEKIAGCKPRKVGLSATLNDYKSAMEFLTLGRSEEVIKVGIKCLKRKISLCVESFILHENRDEVSKVLKEYNSFLYSNCHNKKCIIFTNSKSNAEETIKNLKQEAINRGEPDIFYVHHGNVSAALRKEAEIALKRNEGPTVSAATFSLELGIDIGDLDSTIQIGTPFKVSSFVQRLGRSGRKSGKSQMMFLNLYEEKNKNFLGKLPWELLISISIIQLYLEERWVEPFEKKKKPFSLLAHQTLSILMSYGELLPSELARKVLFLPAFKNIISLEEYSELLRFMIKNEYLQRLESGGIIVGLKGEKICNHFSFYAVFNEEESYRVLSNKGEIGTLNSCPDVGKSFVLAGHSWVVVDIDKERKKIYVNKVKNSNIPLWRGEGEDVNTKILERIKKILQEDTVYPYLQKNAVELLIYARKVARTSGILDKNIINSGGKTYHIYPWAGTKQVRTIYGLLSYGLKDYLNIYSVSNDKYYLTFVSGLEKNELANKLKKIDFKSCEPDMVLNKSQVPRNDKYDYMVPDNLLRSAYLFNQTDIEAAKKILTSLDFK